MCGSLSSVHHVVSSLLFVGLILRHTFLMLDFCVKTRSSERLRYYQESFSLELHYLGMLVWLFQFEQFCVSLTNINMYFIFYYKFTFIWAHTIIDFFPNSTVIYQLALERTQQFCALRGVYWIQFNYISDTQGPILRKSKGNRNKHDETTTVHDAVREQIRCWLLNVEWFPSPYVYHEQLLPVFLTACMILFLYLSCWHKTIHQTS